MNSNQSPISLPVESRMHLTPAVLALAVAVASLGVALGTSDDGASQPQPVRVVQPIGYGSGV